MYQQKACNRPHCCNYAFEACEQHRGSEMDRLIGLILNGVLENQDLAHVSNSRVETCLVSFRGLAGAQKSHECVRERYRYQTFDREYLIAHYESTLQRILGILMSVACQVKHGCVRQIRQQHLSTNSLASHRRRVLRILVSYQRPFGHRSSYSVCFVRG
jgi:hypothetical protein